MLEPATILRGAVAAAIQAPSDETIDWLDRGLALAAVLLRATSIGLSAAFVNQLLEFADLHHEVGRLCGVAEPQMVIRLGYAPPVERAAPRREIDDVYDDGP